MKFSINASELQTALTTVSKGAHSHSTQQILTGIYLSASNDTLTLESTDLDLSIRLNLSALVEEEGQTVIPSKLFLDVVKSLPDSAVHIEYIEGSDTTNILCETASFSLPTLSARDFPGFPEVAEEESISIPFASFRDMVRRVARIIPRDAIQSTIDGVWIAVDEGELKMVATDTYRLAITQVSVEGVKEGFKALVSAPFLQDLAGLSEADPLIEIALAENQVVARYGSATFINRRIESSFIPYERYLETDYQTVVRFDTAQLKESVKRISLLSSKIAPIRFSLNGPSQTTQLSTASQDVGTAAETIHSEIEGDDFEVGFNSAYLIDGLSSVETETVSLELQGPGKAGILRAAPEQQYLYLVMPMRI